MAEARSASLAKQATAGTARPKTFSRASSFKYYIHDGVDVCRLQLIGEFTEREVPELDGCWRTTRTILGARKLVLDVRGVTGVDETGKRWLASMGSEGAQYLPETFLQKCISGAPLAAEKIDPPPKMGFLGRLLAPLRARADAAES